jgi:hypothetical protein
MIENIDMSLTEIGSEDWSWVGTCPGLCPLVISFTSEVLPLEGLRIGGDIYGGLKATI